METRTKRRPMKMLARVVHLYFLRPDTSARWVRRSYNEISPGYDQTWTSHMRDRTEALIGRLEIRTGCRALDLTCGTGFATRLLAARTGGPVVGVDASEGMLGEARAQSGAECEYIRADILDFLREQPAGSFDLVTCCWGLGYSRPLAVLRQVRRVLKKGGRLAVIDNTLFSLREVLYCSFLTFLEQPDMLENLMKFRFLMNSAHLRLWLRLAGLSPVYSGDGRREYRVATGRDAIERLHATGAAAGFEYAASEENAGPVFERFAEILERKYLRDGGIPIIHRYLEGIAEK